MRNPFKGSDYPYGNRKRITPEGEPLEGSGVSRSLVKIVVPIIIGIIIIAVIAISSVRIVDAGNRLKESHLLLKFQLQERKKRRKLQQLIILPQLLQHLRHLSKHVLIH